MQHLRTHRNTIAAVIIFFSAAFVACSSAETYSPDECRRLARRVSIEAPLTQADYKSMITQGEDIYRYLIEKAADVPKDSTLRSDPEFMQRLDYMFTFSSVLYRAHLGGQLNAENTAAYENLDRYASQFAAICDAL